MAKEGRLRFVLLPVDRAEAALLAFHRWDEAALNTFPWRRLTVFNDPNIGVVVSITIVLVIAVIRLVSMLW